MYNVSIYLWRDSLSDCGANCASCTAADECAECEAKSVRNPSLAGSCSSEYPASASLFYMYDKLHICLGINLA